MMRSAHLLALRRSTEPVAAFFPRVACLWRSKGAVWRLCRPCTTIIISRIRADVPGHIDLHLSLSLVSHQWLVYSRAGQL